MKEDMSLGNLDTVVFHAAKVPTNVFSSSLATQPPAFLHIKPTNISSPFIQLVINKRDERLQVNERIIWHSPINHNLSN